MKIDLMKRSMTKIGGCSLFLAAVMCAHANDVIPAPFYSGVVGASIGSDVTYYNNHTPDSVSSACNPGGPCASVSFTAGPSESTMGSVTAYSGQSYLSYDTFYYNYEIVAPEGVTPPAFIQLQFRTNLSVSVTGALTGSVINDYADALINGYTGQSGVRCAWNNAICPADSRTDTLTVYAAPGTAYLIQLVTHISVDNSNAVSSSTPTIATALADPTITFADAGLYSQGYSIVLSDGIGVAAAAAPEPGTFGLAGALVVAGVFGFGRRKKD